MLPLRPRKPRAVGCGPAALYYNPTESLRAARSFHATPAPFPLPIPLPQIPLPNSVVSPRRRRRAPAVKASTSCSARRTKAVRKFRPLLPLPALRPGTGRAPLGFASAALYYNSAMSSRAARIPERGRPARSSYRPARAQKICNAPAPMPRLRPGRPRSLGCGFAALCPSRLCGQKFGSTE